MKANKFIIGLLALSASPLASAATFEVTGATAFRRATIEAIEDLFDTSGVDFAFAHNRTAGAADYINADFITFKGTIAGFGPTVVRCSFNGSIEGLRALAEPGDGTGPNGFNGNAFYILESQVTAAPSPDGTNQIIAGIDVNNPALAVTAGIMDRAEAEMAFSDTEVAISPYDPSLMVGGSPAGLVFAVVASDPTGTSGAITNVTTQQYNSLLTNGFVPKSFFTGLTTDAGTRVFCTGRNDGSGTRSSYLAEMGFGVSNPVSQYLVVSQNITGATGQFTALQRVPIGGTNDSDGNSANGVQLPVGSAIKAWNDLGGSSTVTQAFTSASTVWGQDQAGNGGAFSGSVLRGHLAQNGPSVRVFNALGGNLFGGVPIANPMLVSWISLNDAITARSGGATICAFNGVSLAVNGAGNTMTTADRDKVLGGQYSAWNFQQFYYVATLAEGDPAIDLYNSIFASVANGNLGAAGLKSADFKIGRSGDGGTINPL